MYRVLQRGREGQEWLPGEGGINPIFQMDLSH